MENSNDMQRLIDQARAAEATGDWRLAEQRWSAVRTTYPAIWFGHAATALSMRHQGKIPEATDILLETIMLFPDQLEPALDLANLLDNIDAEKRQEAATSLEHMLSRHIHSHPKMTRLLHAYALTAKALEQWEIFFRRARQVAEIEPDNVYLQELATTAAELLLSYNPDALKDFPTLGPYENLKAINKQVEQPIKSLITCFESLGGGGQLNGYGYGCEFGFFQRSLGFEPLSLLRWVTIDPDDLILALNARFAEIGKSENILMRTHSKSDWAYTDLSYNIRCDHTHLNRFSVNEEEARELIQTRLKFLTRKLLQDLNDGDKIFTYRVFGYCLAPKKIHELAKAITKYGKNSLFFVTYSDEQYAPGTVIKAHDGLLMGYIDRFATDKRDEYPDDPDNHKGWTTLCKAAFDLWSRNKNITIDY
jgi:hypothetical protein